jgi:hypothetical protein
MRGAGGGNGGGGGRLDDFESMVMNEESTRGLSGGKVGADMSDIGY